MARSRQTGELGPLEPVTTIRAQRWTDQLRDRVEAHLAQGAVGSPATVRSHLGRLFETTGAEEVVAFSSTYDRDAQAASDAALRELLIG
jgi:TorA maturation chaperone TorD